MPAVGLLSESQSVLSTEACRELSESALVFYSGTFCCTPQPQRNSLIIIKKKLWAASPSHPFWRPDSHNKTEWGGICLNLTKDLSWPLTAMVDCHGSELMRTVQPPFSYCHYHHQWTTPILRVSPSFGNIPFFFVFGEWSQQRGGAKKNKWKKIKLFIFNCEKKEKLSWAHGVDCREKAEMHTGQFLEIYIQSFDSPKT